MATPVGHTIMGLVIARRMGVRSPLGLAAAAVGANLPDFDLIPGFLLHGNPWRWHRGFTHTPGFTTTAGMLAGFAGIVSAGSAEGERDLVADAITGAAIVGSHLLFDITPFPPRVRTKHKAPFRRHMRGEAINGLIELVVYGALAWRLWPREAEESAV